MKNERAGVGGGVKTRRFSIWLKEGRKEFPLSRINYTTDAALASRADLKEELDGEVYRI